MTTLRDRLDDLRKIFKKKRDYRRDHELVERVARVIDPVWFSHEIFGNEHSALNNYPNQHLYYQQQARDRAAKVIAMVREEDASGS